MTFRIISPSGDALTLKDATPRNASSFDGGITPIQEQSDVAQTIKELNDDVMQSDKFSSIDMKTRLIGIEISSIIAVDSLVSLDFLPPEASFITRSKKRLSVSLKGRGREEIVGIAQGLQDKEQGGFSKLGALFGGNK